MDLGTMPPGDRATPLMENGSLEVPLCLFGYVTPKGAGQSPSGHFLDEANVSVAVAVSPHHR